MNKTFRFPKTNALLAVNTYVLISLIVIGYGYFKLDLSIAHKSLLILLGYLLYTLIEYIFHRFLYHSGEDYKAEENWQYKVHGIHHMHPKDEGLLAMPIPVAILLGAVVFMIFYLSLGDYAYLFWPGFFIGYAIYLYVHYKVHTSKPPKNIFKYLWTHHFLHHYQYEEKAYGVSSPLWDIIFRTMPPNKQDRTKK